jgi:hypothetical protein
MKIHHFFWKNGIYVLRIWNNHNIPQPHLNGSSIERMQPLEFMRFVKDETSMDLQATIDRTKLWETINVTIYYLPNSTPMKYVWIFNTRFPNVNTINSSFSTHTISTDICKNVYFSPSVG